MLIYARLSEYSERKPNAYRPPVFKMTKFLCYFTAVHCGEVRNKKGLRKLTCQHDTLDKTNRALVKVITEVLTTYNEQREEVLNCHTPIGN